MHSLPKRLTPTFFLFLFCIFPACQPLEEPAPQPPNIILILADDLGYGELGAFGQSLIETPHLDALAEGGMRFTQFYTGAPVCAPARSILLTGLHAGHTPIRGNDEWGARGDVWNFRAMFENPTLEGQRPMADSTVTMGERLQQAGYTTGMVGKWGLGAPDTEGVPNRQGFDFFYGYLCQRQAHTYYPTHLWKNEERVLLNNPLVAPHQNLPDNFDPQDPASYAPYQSEDYAPALMHQEAIKFLKDNRDGPFFLYYASPIPHLALQAPQRWVDHYRGKLEETDPYTGRSYFPSQYPRATYAAMISYLDEQIGDLVEQLKALGVYENTLILFTSDNGPTYTGGADTPYFKSAHPFITAEGRGKGSVYEGGIRVPTIAHWPGHIPAGSTTDHMAAFYDILPTLMEVADAPMNVPTDGASFLPSLKGQDQPQPNFLYWEFPAYNGQQAVRMGAWKGIRENIFDGHLELKLFNLDADLQEQSNVADQHPDIVAQIEAIMAREHVPSPNDRFKFPQLGD